MPPNPIFTTLALLALTTQAHAQWATPQPPQAGEILILPIPNNFKVASRISRNGVNIQEVLPQSQSLDNWSERITSQVFLNNPNVDPAKFLSTMESKWAAACPGSAPGQMFAGHVNNFPIAVTFLRCPKNPSTGKPENVLVRVISGGSNIYTVRFAFRYDPVTADISRAAKYLASTQVCDPSTPTHPCPQIENKPPTTWQ